MPVRVLGAGILGLSVAAELIRRGHRVEVVDPRPGLGASAVAAGMLSPAGEAWFGEEEMLGVGLRSAAAWPAYAERLGVALHRGGTVLVGYDRGDRAEVERQARLLGDHGQRVELLDADRLRAREPQLSSRLSTGILLPEDHSIDPREVLDALLRRVGPILPTPTDRTCALTVLATGAALPAPYTGLVRRVRGEIALVLTDHPPRGTVRGLVRGRPVYLVPREDGRVVVGATSEEHDAPAVPTLGGFARLLSDARELYPVLDGAELLETRAGDRPAAHDNRPLVGPTGDPGVLLAAGAFRHGVLLAPAIADQIADLVEGDAAARVDPVWDPRRFDLPTPTDPSHRSSR